MKFFVIIGVLLLAGCAGITEKVEKVKIGRAMIPGL